MQLSQLSKRITYTIIYIIVGQVVELLNLSKG